MNLLEVGYHWAPRTHRGLIREKGLLTNQRGLSSPELRWPWVCLGPAPRAAWSISGDMDWAQEIQFWDLWQVELSPSDDIRLRNDSGQRIIEIRVHNTIPPDRVWWVGEREPWVVEEES